MTKVNSITLANEVEKKKSFAEVLSYRAKRDPKKIFLIYKNRNWTYEEFNENVNQCCHYFKKLKLKRGDIVSVILKNKVDFLIIYFSCMRMKLIVNPFPMTVSVDELIIKIKSCRAKIVFCEKSYYTTLQKKRIPCIDVENINKKNLLQEIATYSKKFNEVKLKTSNDIAVLYYSSGTTGSPKLIEYTHKSIIKTQASMTRAGFTNYNSTHLCVLPLGHTASLRYSIKQCISTSSTVVLYESFWKIRSNIWKEIEKYEVNFMQVVPSILEVILNTPYTDFNKSMIKSVQFIGCGSSFLSNKTQEKFEKKFGIVVSNLYGLSELGATHFDDPSDINRKKGSIGKPFDIVKTIIIDENGKEVNNTVIGEIAISTPGLLKNYRNNKKLYKNCFIKNFFKTGDLGFKDNNGYFYYVDRKKDIIIKGGVNVIPSQIDNILINHPKIIECATIGTPDPLFGETIKSFIVTKKNISIPTDELIKYVEKKIGKFKTPSSFVHLKSLPRNASGKILKRKLREF